MTVGSNLKADNSSQTIKLTVSDVLGINDHSTLYISGNANDKVDLGADDARSLEHLLQRPQLLKQRR